MPRDSRFLPATYPHNLEAEQAVLGAVMYDPSCFPDLGNLTAADFHDPVHAKIWLAITRRLVANKVADPITIIPDFDGDSSLDDMGGVSYLGDLFDRANPLSAPSYADTLRQYTHRRQLSQIGDRLATAAQFGDADGIQDAESSLATLRTATSPFRISPISVSPGPQILPRDWLYGHHLIRRYVSTTIAPGGLGKSSLVMAEAVAMAAGKRLLGDRPASALRVLYWNGEDPQDELERRLAAIFVAHHVSNQDLDGRLFVHSGRDMPMQLANMTSNGVVMNETAIAQIIQQLRHHKIDVFALDPFVSIHQVPENDNGAIDAVVKRGLARIAHEANCAIEVVHHVRKPGSGAQQDTSVDDARGASALIGAVRSARVLNVMTTEEAEKAGIANRYQYFRVDNGKSNLAPRSDQATWRQIISVDLENGVPPDYVAAIVSYELPGLYSNVSANQVAEIQSRIGQSDYRADSQAATWAGHVVGAVLAMDSDNEADAKRIKAMIAGWVKSGLLETVKKTDPETRKKKDFIVMGIPIHEVEK